MPLERGTKLGPYQIESPIGAGGMGEVYKATDTRLERTVAIKVLPAHVASDPERKSRFEREAKTISSLNHPHICTLYEFDSQDGTDFLVMEYLEGETLAERLTKGALPLDQALKYAIEIADALDKAHRQGVTHRDLKPANIMLTKAGAKLLDFGLAKLKPTGPQSEASTKLADALTEQGTILGTFQYMAPEQLEGGEADHRTDIWAFGCVVYEMVTGQKAFEGTSQASLISAIMKDEPRSMASLQPLSLPMLDQIVRICLAKDPDERWQGAGDIGRQLKLSSESGTQIAVSAPATLTGRPTAWQRTTPLAATALGTAVIVGLTAWSLMRPDPLQVVRTTVATPRNVQLRMTPWASDVIISPQGDAVAYLGVDDTGETQVYVRLIDQFESTKLNGLPANVDSPFMSPDGRWIGFFHPDSTAMMKVSIAGGAPITIADNDVDVYGASWGVDDTIVFGRGNQPGDGLSAVPASGGEPTALTTPNEDAGEVTHRWPEVLPGGQAVLFTIHGTGGEDDRHVAVLMRDTREWNIIIRGGSNPRFVPTGHIVYVANGALRAVAFDPKTLDIVGDPFPVPDAVDTKQTGSANFGVSRNGSLVHSVGGSIERPSVLGWLDRQGQVEQLPLRPGRYVDPSLSPDGQQVAFADADESGRHIWVYDLNRETLGKRTFDVGTHRYPIWTPDGEQLTYSAAGRIMQLPADGSGQPELMAEADVYLRPIGWSPDGQLLTVQRLDGDLVVYSATDSASPRPLVDTPGVAAEARFSPDGSWIAYRSDETGRDEVYVQPYPGPGGKHLLSVDGGTQPMWSHDGSELFYRSRNRMMRVAVTTGSSFSAGSPQVLFEAAFWDRDAGDPNRYSVSPDGERFLAVVQSREVQESTPEIRLILNWSSELERLVPTP